MRLGRTIKPEVFFKLLKVVINTPYLVKADFAYEFCRYITTRIDDSQSELFADEIDKHLCAMYNHFERDGIETGYNLPLWLFSLASLVLRGQVNDYSKTGFLLGLQYVFLERNSLQRSLVQPPPFFFQAGNLLRMSYPLFVRINPDLIKEIVASGESSNIPEIGAVCHILIGLAGIK